MDLGLIPGNLVVHLTRGGGFRAGLESIGEPWNPAAQIVLVFTPPQDAATIEWPATIDGALVLWRMGVTDVAEVLDSGADSVWLRSTEPGFDPDVWKKGYVHVH